MVPIMARFLSSTLSEMLISEFFISTGCCRGYLRFLELSQAVMAFWSMVLSKTLLKSSQIEKNFYNFVTPNIGRCVMVLLAFLFI